MRCRKEEKQVLVDLEVRYRLSKQGTVRTRKAGDCHAVQEQGKAKLSNQSKLQPPALLQLPGVKCLIVGLLFLDKTCISASVACQNNVLLLNFSPQIDPPVTDPAIVVHTLPCFSLTCTNLQILSAPPPGRYPIIMEAVTSKPHIQSCIGWVLKQCSNTEPFSPSSWQVPHYYGCCMAASVIYGHTAALTAC